MIVRCSQQSDKAQLVRLIADFRVELGALRGRESVPDTDAAERELLEYQNKGYPIFVADAADGELAGYLVCRVDEKTVWAESLFVQPQFRRMRVASALYGQAEQLAKDCGAHTVYNWVHPNNEAIIAFLRKRGYNVLNLVELRRQRPGEEVTGSVQVGSQVFRY